MKCVCSECEADCEHLHNGEWKRTCGCKGGVLLIRRAAGRCDEPAFASSLRLVTEADWQFLQAAKAVYRGWQDMPQAEKRALVASHHSFEWGFGQMEEWAPEIQEEQREHLRKVVGDE